MVGHKHGVFDLTSTAPIGRAVYRRLPYLCDKRRNDITDGETAIRKVTSRHSGRYVRLEGLLPR